MYEHIFQLIRSGETVLFIGSGCSIKAGFPSGTKLSKILYDKLTPNEQKRISPEALLPDMATYFVKVRSRQDLISVITEVFSRKAEPSPFHELLASIPCWKDIITTNYDSLIETYLGQDKCDVIRCNADCAYMVSKKKHLLKIHGDIIHKDDIVLTREDYKANRFASGSKNDALWGITQTLMTTRNIIFMGYSIGDPNIDDILERIENSLGKNKRKMYLVAPGWEEEDIKDLYRREVDYINMTGTEFLQKLYENIEENVMEELESGRIEAANTVFQRHKLMPIMSFRNNKLILTDIQTSNGEPIIFDLDITPDPLNSIINTDYIRSFDPEPMRVSNKMLLDLNLKANGLNILSKKDNRIFELRYKPIFKENLDIHFDDGTSYNSLPVKMFDNAGKRSVVFRMSILEGVLELEGENYRSLTFTYEKTKKCTNVFKARNEIKILIDAMSGIPFYIKDDTFSFDPKGPVFEEFLAMRTYYEKVLEIRQYFNLDFQSFDNFSKDSFKAVSAIHSKIKGYAINNRRSGNFTFNLLNSGALPDASYSILFVDSSNPVIINLFGKEYNVGYQYDFYQNLKLITSADSPKKITFEITDNTCWTFYYEKFENFNVKAGFLLENENPIEGSLVSFIKSLKVSLDKKTEGQDPFEKLQKLKELQTLQSEEEQATEVE